MCIPLKETRQAAGLFTLNGCRVTIATHKHVYI